MAVTAAELKEKFNLTDKRAKFVIEYFNQDFNAAQAAITAGYSKKTCRSSAYQLLTNIDIQKALAYAREKMMASLEISEDHILKRLATQAFARLTDFCAWDADGNVTFTPSADLPEDSKGAVCSIKKRSLPSGVVETEIRMKDSLPALVKLGEHLGLFGKATVNHKHSGTIEMKPVEAMSDRELQSELEALLHGSSRGVRN